MALSGIIMNTHINAAPVNGTRLASSVTIVIVMEIIVVMTMHLFALVVVVVIAEILRHGVGKDFVQITKARVQSLMIQFHH